MSPDLHPHRLAAPAANDDEIDLLQYWPVLRTLLPKSNTTC